MSQSNDFNAFDELEDIIKDFASKTDDESVLDLMEVGAGLFLKDLLKLPKPKSRIIKSTHTHLVDSFDMNRTKIGVEVRWGKFYGPIVEKKQPHMRTLFDRNKDRYYQEMINKVLR